MWEEGVVLSSSLRPVPNTPSPPALQEGGVLHRRSPQRLPGAWPSSWGLKARGKLLGQGKTLCWEPAQTFVCSPSFSLHITLQRRPFALFTHVYAKAHRI